MPTSPTPPSWMLRLDRAARAVVAASPTPQPAVDDGPRLHLVFDEHAATELAEALEFVLEERRRQIASLVDLLAASSRDAGCRYAADPDKYPRHACRTNAGEPVHGGQVCMYEAHAQLAAQAQETSR